MKPSRTLSPIGTYFITTATWERRALFRSDRFARLLLDIVYGYREQSRYRIHQFVVMPEHVHLLITPNMDVTIERAAQFIKGGFSHAAKKHLGFTGEVWQRGFADRRIREEQEFRRFSEYILRNPVKRGLVHDATAYPYCSACAGFEIDPWP